MITTDSKPGAARGLLLEMKKAAERKIGGLNETETTGDLQQVQGSHAARRRRSRSSVPSPPSSAAPGSGTAINTTSLPPVKEFVP